MHVSPPIAPPEVHLLHGINIFIGDPVYDVGRGLGIVDGFSDKTILVRFPGIASGHADTIPFNEQGFQEDYALVPRLFWQAPTDAAIKRMKQKPQTERQYVIERSDGTFFLSNHYTEKPDASAFSPDVKIHGALEISERPVVEPGGWKVIADSRGYSILSAPGSATVKYSCDYTSWGVALAAHLNETGFKP